MKKGKKVAMESSPQPYQVGKEEAEEEEAAKARSRHQSLMLDYLDLQKEIEAKRKKLSKAKKEKCDLLGVVKFLQKKVKSFSKNPSHGIQHRLRKRPLRLSPPSNLHSKLPVKDCREIREASVRSSTTLLDLNQILLPNGEEMDEFQAELKPSTTGLPKWKVSVQDQIAVRV
ncbi:uncharacterized protein M6B38_360490 [Iris pallida]|uniref:Uncharacterized protein n=1 Tax=Iris pallida TaxID=29817 RepID=A0AAX6GKK5_IRIPA|nr:uncharacterized protein M6B38_360490 [Iris pallida]